MARRKEAGGRRVRLLFADDGAYHRETLTLPSESLDRYERLIDCLREDPDVLARVHVDVDRLCAAYLVDGDDEGA
jgi:hypothetical protein